jgi:hypothetical protein
MEWPHDTEAQLGNAILTQTMHLDHEQAGRLRASIVICGEYDDTQEKPISKPGTSPDNDASHVATLHVLDPPKNKQCRHEDKQYRHEDTKDF